MTKPKTKIATSKPASKKAVLKPAKKAVGRPTELQGRVTRGVVFDDSTLAIGMRRWKKDGTNFSAAIRAILRESTKKPEIG